MVWPWCLQGLGILNIKISIFGEREVMVITINKGDSKKAIVKKLKNLPEQRGFKAYKFLGKVKIDEDALVIQKQLRDGWKKRIR